MSRNRNAQWNDQPCHLSVLPPEFSTRRKGTSICTNTSSQSFCICSKGTVGPQKYTDLHKSAFCNPNSSGRPFRSIFINSIQTTRVIHRTPLRDNHVIFSRKPNVITDTCKYYKTVHLQHIGIFT